MTRVAARTVLLPAGFAAFVVAAWWGLVVAFGVPAYLLPTPAAVADRLLGAPDLYLRSAVATLRKVLVGGGIGAAGGFIVAVAIAASSLLRRAVFPYLVALRVLPKVAVAPVLLIYVGTGFTTAVGLVALIAFFPMVVSTSAGLASTPERALDLLASVRAGRTRTFLAVRLPYALPDVFAGLKQSVTLAVVGAIVAEWIVGTDGLGFLVLLAAESVQPDVLLSAVLVAFVEGALLYGGVVLLQRATPRTD